MFRERLDEPSGKIGRPTFMRRATGHPPVFATVRINGRCDDDVPTGTLHIDAAAGGFFTGLVRLSPSKDATRVLDNDPRLNPEEQMPPSTGSDLLDSRRERAMHFNQALECTFAVGFLMMAVDIERNDS
jgi:hypothetical protein